MDHLEKNWIYMKRAISLGFGKGKNMNSEYQASFHFKCY